MKLATYTTDQLQSSRVAVVADRDQSLIDIQEAYTSRNRRPHPALMSMQALIESGEEGLSIVRDIAASDAPRISIAHVKLLAPLPVPAQIRDCLCFEGHLTGLAAAIERSGGKVPERHADMMNTLRERPLYYKANRFAVVGPDADVVWPSYSKVIDYELEMAAVIGRRAKDISAAAAPTCIFGYTIFNDFSARDAQRLEMPGSLGPTKGKDFDSGNSFGPWIVTADAFDPYTAKMQARVNGEVWSVGNGSTMTYRFDALIEYISQSETLYPGEILGSGTVGGGCGAEVGRFLSPGDTVELEIDGIGILRNRIAASKS